MNNRYPQSNHLWSQAKSIILNGVLTLSKSPRYLGEGTCPIFVKSAKGAYFWDYDDNRYLDYPLALGPIILGYANEEVDSAVKEQMSKGFLYSLSSPKEPELAELLCRTISSAEKVRFLKSGSEAMSAAVRIARAFTGREKVAVCGYHGWHDWTISRSKRNKGVPQAFTDLVFEFSYNDWASLEKIYIQHPGQIAAVILEPVGMEAPQEGFLERVAESAKRNGALLIFDEIITGFRMALGGAQEYFKVHPDLSAFGKAMANGYPIAAVVGKKKIMEAVEEEVFISSTYGGDLLSITAALKTIEILKRDKVNPYILGLGQKLKEGLNQAARKSGVQASCQGMPHKTFMVFDDHGEYSGKLLETIFRQECLARGVFLGYGHFISFSHTEEDIQHSVTIASKVLSIMHQSIEKGDLLSLLKGRMAEDVFKRY